MKYFIIVLAVFSLMLAQDLKAQEEQPKLIALTMHADWCGTCKVLNPKVDEIKKEFENKGVFFTKFDKTDDFTTSQSVLYAQLLGLTSIFEDHKEKTGYMLLINAETREVVGRITADKSKEEIKSTIRQAL